MSLLRPVLYVIEFLFGSHLIFTTLNRYIKSHEFTEELNQIIFFNSIVFALISIGFLIFFSPAIFLLTIMILEKLLL